MVSKLAIFFMIVSAFICIFAPIIIAVIMVKKYKANWKAFLLGATVFIVSQPLLRIPILNQLGNSTWYVLFINSNTVLYLTLIGLSAGIFEEVGRFIGIKFFLKRGLNWENGVVFGLGHGGIEAFLLVGLNYSKVILNVITGQAIKSIVNVPSYLFLFGGIERILAITLHIGMTMLVLYSIKYKKRRYLFYAILFHTLIDSPLLILKQVGLDLNVWITTGYIAVFAILALIITVKFKATLNKEKIE